MLFLDQYGQTFGFFIYSIPDMTLTPLLHIWSYQKLDISDHYVGNHFAYFYSIINCSIESHMLYKNGSFSISVYQYTLLCCTQREKENGAILRVGPAMSPDKGNGVE